jgi:hypothetical protein
MDKQEAFGYKWLRSNGEFYYGIHRGSEDDGYTGSGVLFKDKFKNTPIEEWCRSIEIRGSYNNVVSWEKHIVTEDLLLEPLCLNLMVGGLTGPSMTKDNPKYLGWIESLKLGRKGRKPSLGMKHTENTKILCGEFAKKRWDGRRTKDNFKDEMFMCGSPKIALDLYGIPRTTYYRRLKELNIKTNEVISKQILSKYSRQTDKG